MHNHKEEFNKQILDAYNRLHEIYPNKNITIWDCFVSLTDCPRYLLALRADLPVLQLIARGFSVRSIHEIMYIPSKVVSDIAFTWAVIPLKVTLDFNPLWVYHSGMTAEQMSEHMRDILAVPIDLFIYRCIIKNIERYKLLEELAQKEIDDYEGE